MCIFIVFIASNELTALTPNECIHSKTVDKLVEFAFERFVNCLRLNLFMNFENYIRYLLIE